MFSCSFRKFFQKVLDKSVVLLNFLELKVFFLARWNGLALYFVESKKLCARQEEASTINVSHTVLIVLAGMLSGFLNVRKKVEWNSVKGD